MIFIKLVKDGSPSLKTAICNAHRWCPLADKGEWKCECLKLKELLNNNRDEVDHLRRIVSKCKRDKKDFDAAIDSLANEFGDIADEIKAKMTAETSTMRSDIDDIQETLITRSSSPVGSGSRRR